MRPTIRRSIRQVTMCKISECKVSIIGKDVKEEFMKEFKEALMKKLKVVMGETKAKQ